MDTDLVLDGPGNNDAYGHVVLNLPTGTGVVTFSGGTGRFSGFHASVAVTCTASTPVCTGTERTASPRPATTNKPVRNP